MLVCICISLSLSIYIYKYMYTYSYRYRGYLKPEDTSKSPKGTQKGTQGLQPSSWDSPKGTQKGTQGLQTSSWDPQPTCRGLELHQESAKAISASFFFPP